MYMINPTSAPAAPDAPASGLQSPRGAIVFTLFILVFAFSLAIYFFILPSYRRDQLIKNGLPADATILQIDPTGSTHNSQPEVRIKLQVRPVGAEPYTAETVMVINPVYLVNYRPGTQAHVRYDKDDRTKVVIEEIAVVQP